MANPQASPAIARPDVPCRLVRRALPFGLATAMLLAMRGLPAIHVLMRDKGRPAGPPLPAAIAPALPATTPAPAGA